MTETEMGWKELDLTKVESSVGKYMGPFRDREEREAYQKAYQKACRKDQIRGTIGIFWFPGLYAATIMTLALIGKPSPEEKPTYPITAPAVCASEVRTEGSGLDAVLYCRDDQGKELACNVGDDIAFSVRPAVECRLKKLYGGQ